MVSQYVSSLLSVFPLRKTILLESIPDMGDNTKAVFDEMIKRELNRKYKLVWIVRNCDGNLPKIKNVSYVRDGSLRMKLLRITSKYLICCNQWIRRIRKGQIAFYLSHGTPIKSVRDYYYMPEGFDYCLVASDEVAYLQECELKVSKEKIFAAGFPRNDVLTNAKCNIHKLFSDRSFDKVIVWYPTYRYKEGGDTKKRKALPILHDPDRAVKLNECARKMGVLIVLKPHFAQNTSHIRDLNLSNIVFIDDTFFAKHGVTSYEFVGSCDAMISDYSSIYFDYTLCDKPIALIWEDYDEYMNWPGFAKGVEPLLEGGEKVYTLEELEQFIKNVAEGKDRLKSKRNEICDKVNYSRDGKNAERVVDFIIEKAAL